jgi:hypothetical protein
MPTPVQKHCTHPNSQWSEHNPHPIGCHCSPRPGSPFAAFASFRYPADPVGRFPGGCVNRKQRNDIKINMPQEILDIMTRYNSFAIGMYGLGPRDILLVVVEYFKTKKNRDSSLRRYYSI